LNDVMSALGRILQAIGWIWVIAGFAGPFGGFDVGGALPGVILIFVARVLRTQAARRSPEDVALEPDEPTRILNTERPTTVTPWAPPVPPVPTMQTQPVAEPPVSGDDPLTRFLAVGDEPEPTKKTTPSDPTPSISPEGADDKPKTSAELIAEARRRWDPQN
jgi:hypothetical protein